MKALKDAERITHEATSALDAGDWAPERLERDREPTDGTQDALDQLVACARSLTEDVRRAASFIQGNASLLFRSVFSRVFNISRCCLTSKNLNFHSL